MIIYLVRHSETIWNREGRFQGRLNSALTEHGISQATAAGDRLRDLIPLDVPVSVEVSPLGRTMQTAGIICTRLGISDNEISIQQLLIEHDMGYWQGMTRSEVDRQFPGARAKRESNKWNYEIPGGESYEKVSLRAREWLELPRDAAVLIAVTHEMISRTIQGAYSGMTSDQTLKRSHPQNVIYRLSEGYIHSVSTT